MERPQIDFKKILIDIILIVKIRICENSIDNDLVTLPVHSLDA